MLIYTYIYIYSGIASYAGTKSHASTISATKRSGVLLCTLPFLAASRGWKLVL